MYFTTFRYDDGTEHFIIHKQPAVPYAEDLASYKEYIGVSGKPSFEEASVIFKHCSTNTLCTSISKATTVEIKPANG